MKKSIKIALILSLSVILCCGGVALAFGVQETQSFGFCNEKKTISYVLDVFGKATDVTRTADLAISRDTAYSPTEALANGSIMDCEKDGDFSKGEWQYYTDKEGDSRRVLIKNLTIGYGITVIGENDFCGQTGLKNITLPATLKQIKDGAFENCDSIEQIKFFGTPEQWNALTVGQDNGIFSKTYEQLVSDGIMYVPSAGDVNLDGVINSTDSSTLAKYIAGRSTEICLVGADANGDGKINVSDCVKIEIVK